MLIATEPGEAGAPGTWPMIGHRTRSPRSDPAPCHSREYSARDSSAARRLERGEHTFRVAGEVDSFRMADDPELARRFGKSGIDGKDHEEQLR